MAFAKRTYVSGEYWNLDAANDIEARVASAFGNVGDGIASYANEAALPVAPTGHPTAMTLDTMALYGWDGAKWVPLGSGGANFLNIPVVLSSFANGDMLVWAGSDFSTVAP